MWVPVYASRLETRFLHSIIPRKYGCQIRYRYSLSMDGYGCSYISEADAINTRVQDLAIYMALAGTFCAYPDQKHVHDQTRFVIERSYRTHPGILGGH